MERSIPVRVALVLLFALTTTAVSGCQAAKPQQPAQTESAAKPAAKPAEKVADPIVITPDPGPRALKDPIAESTISVTDGVDEKEAQIAGGYYLRAHREKTLGAGYGTTSEAYTLLNQVKMRGEWLLTYSRTTVDGKPADAYAATIVVDTRNGKLLRVTEAP
jgi:hypothetical protein